MGGALFAQSNDANIQQTVQELSARYQLDEAQQKEMYTIQARQQRNLAEIEVLKESDHQTYLAKKRSIRVNTTHSIRRILTEQQRPILEQELVEFRKETSELIRQYRAEGRSKEEIEQLLLERG